MTMKLGKDSIDLGIVVSDGPKALAFYRDTLGFEHVATMSMAGSTMERLMCGSSLIKIVIPDTLPEQRPAGGGIQGAFGYRYWTITVTNLDELLAKIQANGYAVTVPRRNIRPGVDIAIVEDPEGNLVEFIELTA